MWLLDYLPFWIFHLIVLAGIGGFIVSAALKFVPFVSIYRMQIQIASVIVLVFGLYMEGGISNQEKWEARVAEAKLEMAKKETASAEATTKVVTKYVTQIQLVKEKGDVIIKEVPKYINADVDAKCAIPNAFVVLHDSASVNEVPDPSRLANEGTSSTKLSTVTETVVGNYSICHQNAEQLKSLQEWIQEQQKVYNK
jgi:hypothetical protein